MALNLNALQRPKTGLDLTALGGERTDEFGLPRAEIRARPPEVPFDATKLGIFVNTLRGLPKAAKDLFFPTRGFTEEEIKSARPTFTQKALSVPKIAAEFSSAIGGALGSSPTSRAAEFSQTRLGGKLADIGERITEFGTPKNVEEAAAMRFADVVTAIPVGSIKVSTTAAQAIARTKNLKTIAGLLKKELPSFTDEVAENFGRLLVNIDNADDVQRVLNRTELALQEVRKAGVAPERPTLPEIFAPTTPKTAPQQVVRATDEPLLQEARKYKSAEQFVNSQKPESITNTFSSTKDGGGLWKFLIRDGNIKTKSQLTDIWERANIIDERLAPLADKDGMVTVYRASAKSPKDKLPKDTFVATDPNNARYYAESHHKGEPSDITLRSFKIPASELKRGGSADAWQLKNDFSLTEPSTLAPTGEERNLPAVIQGETFTLGTTKTSQPSTRSLRQDLRAEIKATKQEMKNAKVAAEKAAKLEAKEQKVRTEAMEKINRFRGSTDNIIASLKSRNLSDEDIANIVLEDGTKLIDTAKVKRNADGSLAAVIRKDELEALKANYADEVPKQKWEKRSVLVDGARVPIKAVRSIELPYLWFERKGLNAIYDPIIQAGRDSEALKHSFVQRFKDAGLFKEGGWFTADRFNLSSSEAKHIGQYYLSRQGKGYKVALTDLSDKERKFVEIFDGIIDETEPRFFETAKKNGRTPNKVENYAPIMTSKDFKLVDEGGAMDWLFRNHPSFSALKERVDNVPIKLYETDYREVAARWLDGITDFLTYGETTPKIKYLINSDEFKNIVKETDWQFISNWLRDVTTLEKPTTYLGQAGSTVSRFLRKGVAVGSLGLNYASVLKQALTQIPITLIEKAPPKLRSQYARQFGINVADLPALTKRTGDIALKDLQGKIGRIFTGALTKFDKINAQASLNALLDKEYSKLLKEGVDITPEAQKLIEKRAQDALDMWYGGFFKGQRPEAFRKELFNFILMFTYPLTSQLNGFVRSILNAQGIKKASKIAEVIVSAVAIAYMEQTIQNLSPQWSDEKEMTKDVLQSLAGNIPLVGDLTYALLNEQEIQVSPIIGNVNNVLRKLGQEEGAGWAVAETFGLPKQARRIKEGLEIMEEGGVTDSNGKMLAPVQDTMELVRSFLRGKYGSLAAQDWIRNIGEKSADRRWFVPQVEFLQNGDYERKAQLYRQFSRSEQRELRSFLSDGQQKKLDKALGETGVARPINRRSLEEIFR